MLPNKALAYVVGSSTARVGTSPFVLRHSPPTPSAAIGISKLRARGPVKLTAPARPRPNHSIARSPPVACRARRELSHAFTPRVPRCGPATATALASFRRIRVEPPPGFVFASGVTSVFTIGCVKVSPYEVPAAVASFRYGGSLLAAGSTVAAALAAAGCGV